jgi:hypothetical protein
MIKATERKQVNEDYSLKCGVLEFLPVALNPDKEELQELLGKELDYDPEYLSEDKEGDDQMRLDFWGKDVNNGNFHKVQFYLKNKKVEIEKEVGGKTKVSRQFVNTKGFQAWAESEEKLPAYFLKDAEVHQAREGEGDLLAFITSWIYVEEIELDFKKLMKGNLKDLKDLFSIGKSIVVAAGVKNYTKDGEAKQKQVYFSRSFLPGSWYKEFSTGKYTEAYIEKLKTKAQENKEAKKAGKTTPNKLKNQEYFVLNVAHGFKAFYGPGLTPLHNYDPSLDITSGNEVMQEENTDDSDDSSY